MRPTGKPHKYNYTTAVVHHVILTSTKLGSSDVTSLQNSSLLSVSQEPSLPAYALNWDTSTPIADSITSQEAHRKDLIFSWFRKD